VFARTLLVGLGLALLPGCALLVSFGGLDDGGTPEADTAFDGSSEDSTQALDAPEAPESASPADSAPPPDSGDAGPLLDAALTSIGCFADSQKRDLPYMAYESVYNTVQTCIAACTYHGYLYAGLQDGIQCYCGNSYGGQGPSGGCTTSCPGNSVETCGGPYANDVYRTSVPAE
jgi:hypothetical protein